MMWLTEATKVYLSVQLQWYKTECKKNRPDSFSLTLTYSGDKANQFDY